MSRRGITQRFLNLNTVGIKGYNTSLLGVGFGQRRTPSVIGDPGQEVKRPRF